MNCPHCDTSNESSNQFCVSCGQSLRESPAQLHPLARSAGELLGILTFRLLIVLIGLWLLRAILNWLPFARELRIPNFALSVPALINVAILLIALVLLAHYARTLRALWPRAFPRQQDVAWVLVVIVYLGVLVAAYYMARPLLLAFTTGSEPMLILQAILFLIAIFLLASASLVVYQRLPTWAAQLRENVFFLAAANSESHEVACLNCGRLNSASLKLCMYCGAELSKE